MGAMPMQTYWIVLWAANVKFLLHALNLQLYCMIDNVVCELLPEDQM